LTSRRSSWTPRETRRPIPPTAFQSCYSAPTCAGCHTAPPVPTATQWLAKDIVISNYRTSNTNRRTSNIALANNIFKNMPDTGSPDETAIDAEGYVDHVITRGN
jgi:hypothetical protein